MRLEVFSVLEWILLHVKKAATDSTQVEREPCQIQLNYLCENFMTKYYHPLGMSVSTNTKHRTGDSAGLAVVLIRNPATTFIGFSRTCRSLHLLRKGT